MSEPVFNVLDIVRGTTVDGPGFRTSIYLAGCSHACPGCHNPQSHNPHAGTTMTLTEIMAVVGEEGFDVTLSGGDPLFRPDKAFVLAQAVKNSDFGLWIYTGFTWEQILASEPLREVCALADVVVDSPFIQELRDADLLFRGSSNQRLVDVPASLSAGRMVEWRHNCG